MVHVDDDRDDLVPVQVPRRHLMAVYGFIAGLDGTSATDPVALVVGEANEETWSVEDLQRFAQTATLTSVTIGKVLDVLAEQPGTYLCTSELEELTGVPRNNLKGAFSALTRHINKHYGGRGWMLTFRWGPEIGAGYPAEGHYAVSEEQATRWRDARAA